MIAGLEAPGSPPAMADGSMSFARPELLPRFIAGAIDGFNRLTEGTLRNDRSTPRTA